MTCCCKELGRQQNSVHLDEASQAAVSVPCHCPCYKSIIIINKKNYKHDFETIKEKKEKNYIVLL